MEVSIEALLVKNRASVLVVEHACSFTKALLEQYRLRILHAVSVDLSKRMSFPFPLHQLHRRLPILVSLAVQPTIAVPRVRQTLVTREKSASL